MQQITNKTVGKKLIIIIICLLAFNSQAQKKYYFDWRGHKINVPLGSLAFADKLIDSTPGDPAASRFFTKESYLVGTPDSNMYSLGYGASVSMQFTDNALINIEGPDLYIFEVGGTFEPTQVEISKDGKNWINVGIASEMSAAIDINAFVQDYDKFYFVRLTDLMTNYKPNKRFGADIDAIAALGALDMSSPCQAINKSFKTQLEKWSAKDMFETTIEYQNRLSDSLAYVTKQFKIKAIQDVAHQRAILKYADFNYDADHSVVTINTPNIKGFNFNLKRKKAKTFYKNLNNLEIENPQFTIDCNTGKFVIEKAKLNNVSAKINYVSPNYYQNNNLNFDQKYQQKNLNTTTKIVDSKLNLNSDKVQKVKKSSDFNSKKIKSNELKVGQKFALPNLYFRPDSYELTREAKRTIIQLYKFLKQNPKLKIEIGGHTNTLPPDDYAKDLSTNRAKNVAYYLFNKGISKKQISYFGYGKSRPINTSNTTAARLQNQRVEIKVLAIK